MLDTNQVLNNGRPKKMRLYKSTKDILVAFASIKDAETHQIPYIILSHNERVLLRDHPELAFEEFQKDRKIFYKNHYETEIDLIKPEHPFLVLEFNSLTWKILYIDKIYWLWLPDRDGVTKC